MSDVIENKDSIRTITINDLKGKNFIIPRYQRGYRWQAEHLNKLIDDLNYFFGENKIDKSAYSLQPIVVNEREKGKYYVIDGQQRLTTLWLLSKYYNNVVLTLSYESDNRADTINNFDKSVDENNSKNENADLYHLIEVYNVIKSRLDDNNDLKELLQKELFDNNRISFIWYEPIKGAGITEEIDIFTRFNKGKIPLTDGELIKALFLLSKTYSNSNNQEVLYNQRVIAEQWDNIENKLQDNDFWYFLYNPNNDELKINYQTRIDYLFAIYLIYVLNQNKNNEEKNNKEILNEFKEMIKKDRGLFGYFEDVYNKQKNKEEYIKIWEKIVDIFYTLDEWYNDCEIYHRIGFLIQVQREDIIYKMADLYIESKKQDKNAFKNYIKSEIKKEFKDKIMDAVGGVNKKPHVYLNKTKNIDEKRKTFPILLLYNIETVINEYKKNNDEDLVCMETQEFNRFSFYRCKKERWDIEHINPAHNKDNYDNEREKLVCILKFIAKNNLNKNEKEKIENAYKKLLNVRKNKSKLSDDDKKTIDDDLDDILCNVPNFTDDEKNMISNYCLLNANINRGYGNSLFMTKREWIISKDQGEFIEFEYNGEDFEQQKRKCESSFIPICTKKVFLKYYTKEYTKLLEWTQDDATNYLNDINSILSIYIEKE